jgi:hypothetical protein
MVISVSDDVAVLTNVSVERDQSWSTCLESRHGKLTPYIREWFAPDFIAGMWLLMRQDRSLELAFQAITPGEPFPALNYNPTSFARYFSDTARVTVSAWAKATEETPEEIAGLLTRT